MRPDSNAIEFGSEIVLVCAIVDKEKRVKCDLTFSLSGAFG